MAHKGHAETSLGALEVSPARRKRQARARRNQERAWAAKAGSVVVRRIDPKPDSSGGPDAPLEAGGDKT